MNKCKIRISGVACTIFALALLILPLRWVLAALIAGIVHELFHIAAIYLCGGKISTITVGSADATISVSSMSCGRELLCALSGPFGGLLTLIFARYIPRIAVCAAFQSLYNLLPIYPLDGGRAVRCIAQILIPKHSDKICRYFEIACIVCMVCLGVYACIWLRLGLLPLLVAMSVAIRKSPCKQMGLRLQ